MSNLLDYQRLSNFVTGVVDRKVVALGQSLVSSTGFITTLIGQAQNYVTQAADHASNAGQSAIDADGAATSSTIILNNFTSTYLGVKTDPPTVSSLGNAINSGAFYIRASDGRLRYTASVDSYGDPIWGDATVSADTSSILSMGAGVFLTLNKTSLQTVTGPITFNGTLLGPRVTNWASQQLATAIDVNERLVNSSSSVAAETDRATAAELLLTNTKVSKSGDTMTSTLSIISTGETASLILRNSAPGGKIWRVSSATDGKLRIIDDSTTVERVAIRTDGTVALSAGLAVTGPATVQDAFINRLDTNDVGMTIQTNNVSRWMLKRSVSSQRFYISRHNSSGVYIDAPFYISETDGSITQNPTKVTGALTAQGTIRSDITGASLSLNNTSGVNDTGVILQHLNYTRWAVGRSASGGNFFINRHNNAGVFTETALSINETSGLVTINGAIVSTTSISTPTLTVSGAINTTSSGTGQNIGIGDDAYIGDGNITNGIVIKGKSSANAGFIAFGNKTKTLGCNAGDDILRYGGDPIVTSTNADTYVQSAFSYGTTDGIDWSMRPAGNGKTYVVFSGTLSFNNENTITTVDYPFTLEKVMAFTAVSCYNTNIVGQNNDTFSAFAQPPGLTQAKLYVNKTSSNSILPVLLRWTVEGIVA